MKHRFAPIIGLPLCAEATCSEAEREEAVRCLERLHLKRFAGAVMYVLQTVFGLEEEHLLVPSSPGRGQRLLAEIMKAGNFGQHDERIRHDAMRHLSAVSVARCRATWDS